LIRTPTPASSHLFPYTTLFRSENVLRAAVMHRVSRFVHISSVAVYGSQPPPHSVSEAAATRPDLPYGHTKLEQERRVLRYRRRRDRKSTRLNSSHDQISYAVFC